MYLGKFASFATSGICDRWDETSRHPWETVSETVAHANPIPAYGPTL